MPPKFDWSDAEEIGIQLAEKYPETDPLTVRYTDLHKSIIALETTYGDTFTAAIARGNLIATQFHPEKSQRAGLRLVRIFIELSKLEAVAR